MSLRRLPYALLALLGALFCTLPASSTCTDCDGDGYEWPVDCNDADPDIYPGAPEACDGFDSDCDASIDNDPACSTECEFPGEIADDLDDLLVSDLTYPAHTPAMAWTGSETGIVWEQQGNIFLTRVNSAGNEIGTEVRANPGAGGDCSQPDLVWTGSEYGLAWRCYVYPDEQIVFARLDSTGAALSLDVHLTTGLGESAFPRVVWTGQEYGIVWQENRDGNWEIYFARVDAIGEPIGGIQRLTDDPADSLTPTLVWAGGEFGVAWQDDRDGNGEIYFVRLDPSGTKLTGDLRITDDAGASEMPELAWTGSEYGLVWQDDRAAEWDVYFALLTAAGEKVGTDVLVTDVPGGAGHPRIQWTGAEYGVSWWDERVTFPGIFFARLDGLGLKIGSDFPLIPHSLTGSFTDPDLVWNGAAFGIVWQDTRAGTGIYFSRVGCDCLDLDGDGFDPCAGDCDESDETVYPGAPQLCDGLNTDCNDPYWPAPPPDETDSDGDGLSGCEGDCDDTRDTMRPGLPEVCDFLDNDCNGQTDEGYDLDADGFTTCGSDCDDAEASVYPGAPQICDGLNNDCDHPSWPALTGTDEVEDWDGDGVTGCEGDCDVHDPATHPGSTEICDARDNDCDGEIDELLTCPLSCPAPDSIAPDVRVTESTGSPNQASLVSAGNGFGVAWQDSQVGDNGIYFARLDGMGDVVAGPTRVIDSPGLTVSPDLFWTGAEFALVWEDGRDGNREIYFTRLDAAGLEIGDDVRISNAPGDSQYPSITWSGSEYGVAWHDDRDGNDEIYFARLDQAGRVLGGETRLTTNGALSAFPQVAWMGSGYAVIWHDNRDGYRQVYLALSDDEGVKWGYRRITEDPDESKSARIAWSGSELGLLWRDERDGQPEIYFARLDASGARLSADLRLTDSPTMKYEPRLIWTGGEYGVAWRDWRDGSYQIYFTRLDSDGAKLLPDLRVSMDAAQTILPSLAWSGSVYGVVWTDDRHDDEIYFTRIACDCIDDDVDGHTVCNDCDDTNGTVHPGAPQICDGLNNDCDHPGWPALANTNEYDDDVDGMSECQGDCDDTLATVRLGLPEICDFLDNDCDGTTDEDFDLDLDGWTICSGDCDDGTADVFPGAPQICDGLNNDCNHPDWPGLSYTNENDDDDDGLTGCEGDCDLLDPESYPGASEICDGRDNDCDGQVDNVGGCDNSCDLPDSVLPDVNVTGHPGRSADASLVVTDTGFAAAWNDARDGNWEIYFGLLADTGQLVGDARRITGDPASQMYPRLVTSGTGFAAVWEDWRASDSNRNDIYFARLDAAGNKIGPDIAVTNSPADSDSPSLVWTGTAYGLVWADDREGENDVYFTQLGLAGERLGPDVRVSTGASASGRPTIAWTGSEYAVSWQDERDGNYEIYFAIVDTAGSVGSNNRITDASGMSVKPCMVWTGSELGILWTDRRSGRDELYFVRLDAAGSRLTADLELTDNVSSYIDNPRLVWSGEEYGVAWTDRRNSLTQARFARLDAAGAKLIPDLRVPETSATTYNPSLAWNGDLYGIVWHDWRLGTWRDQVYFTQIRCDCLDGDGDGVTACNDCDDQSADVFPHAEQICDGLNNDCSHSEWPGLDNTNDGDDDADGLSECDGDCDDTLASVLPGSAEVCDLLDNNCDGSIDEGFDQDADGWTICGGDCDDARGEVAPGASQICDGLNNDCDHPSWPALTGTDEVEDRDGDGLTGCQGDCDVLDPNTYPGALEICDGRDNDCEGGIDEALTCPLSCAAPDKVGPELRVTDSTGYALYPFLVSAGPGSGLAWRDSRHGGYEVYFARLDETGALVAGPTRVTDSPGYAYRPALAWSGSEFGLTWHDTRDGGREIYFTRLDATGLEIGDDVRVSNAAGYSEYPSIAWNGSGYGVVWMDDRDGNDEIYFARLDSAGGVLGEEVRLTEDGGSSSNPQMVWVGTGYAVTWQDDRDGDSEIYLALLDEEGSSSGSLRITAYSGESIRPRIAWSGSELGVLWIDDRDGWRELYFVRLDGSGARLTGDIRVTDDPAYIYEPRLTWTGGEYGVAWRDHRDGNGQIYFTRLDPGGVKLTPDLRISEDPAASQFPGLVWTGSIYGMAWYERDQDNRDEIFFTPLRCDCVDGDGDGTTVCSECDDTNASIYPGAPQVCDGLNNDCDHPSWPALTGTDEVEDRDGDGLTGCLGDCDVLDPSTYPGAAEICDGRDNSCDGEIDESLTCPLSCTAPDKVVPDVRVTDSTGRAYYPVLVSAGPGFGLAWYDSRDGGYEIYFARLDEMGGVVAGPTRVTDSPGYAYRPALAWNGSEFGLTWHDTRDGGREIYFARLDAEGLEIGDDVRVSNAAGYSEYPSIAWNGSGYGVVWMDDRDGNDEIYFARLDSAGGVLGEEVRLTEDGGSSSNPQMVWVGTGYAVTWQDDRDGDSEIYLALLDEEGSSSGSLRITAYSGESIRPRIAWSGSELGVLWIDDRIGQRELYFVRLNGSGTRLTGDIRVTDDPDNIYEPRLTWTGGEYGVAWRDHRDGDGQIYFTRLDPGGVKLTPDLRISEDPAASQFSGLAWTGSVYGVVWYERDQDNRDEIFFTRVRCDCSVDGDGDGYTVCSDCEDAGADIFPRADEICDGVNNDCLSSTWPSLSQTPEWDDDLDGYAECEGDCDDSDSSSAPGAPQACDGINNDCLHPDWPSLVGTNEWTDDGDGFSECAGDCDDADGDVHPFAAQVCDGKNNDCLDAAWPQLTGTNEDDVDGDGPSECEGDNCPKAANPDQANADGDLRGDACDCLVADPDAWSPPTEALRLRVRRDWYTGGTFLSWDEPEGPGTSVPLSYDTLRADHPVGFGGGAYCLEADDGFDAFAADWDVPSDGSIFYYLVRADGACPGEVGSLGRRSDGTVRTGRLCP